MKILKGFLIALAVNVVLFFLAALFAPKNMQAEKEVIINRSLTDVWDYTKYLKNQDNFSKWASLDPNMQKTYSGTDATRGFKSMWKGNKDVGEGEQNITAIQPMRRIEYDLHFIKPMESLAKAYMTFDSTGTNQTKVKWGFNSSMSFPWNAMLLLIDGDKMVGKDFQTGLTNLKGILEK